MYANYVYTKSSKDQPKDFFDANLICSYQARRQFDFEFNGLSRFFDEVESLDFRLTYMFDRAVGQYRLFFEATDLMNGANDLSLTRSQGEIGYINSRSFVGGLEFRFGMTASF